MIYEMFGVPISEARELDSLTFIKLLRDAVCLKLKQTEEGREYLYDCWRYTQSEPDFSALMDYQKSREK